MNQLIALCQSIIGGNSIQTVSARDLYSFLEVGKDFSTWIKNRIDQYGFIEYQDYVIDSPVLGNQIGRGGDRRSRDYFVTLDMAKELSMVERNLKGKQARQYFIECERRALQSVAPQVPQTFAEALRLAADLQDKVEQQAKQLEAAQPAIAFTQAVTDMTGACKIEYVAKTLGYGRNNFFAMLRADEILMPNRMPYQKHLDAGHFIVVEREPWADSAGNKHPAFTTMVTGKGQVYLARKYPATKQPKKGAK